MTTFINTPTNIDFLELIFRNHQTGLWTMPILKFNTDFGTYTPVDPLNDDINYQKNVINNIYFKLTEKWLYKDPIFKSLLKYFKIEKNGDEGQVMLIDDPDNIVKGNENNEYRKYIFRYIEKYLITKRFVSKVLHQYVKTSHIKWYDLFINSDTLKELFAHKIKRLIIKTIYAMQDEKNNSSDKITIRSKHSSRTK